MLCYGSITFHRVIRSTMNVGAMSVSRSVHAVGLSIDCYSSCQFRTGTCKVYLPINCRVMCHEKDWPTV